MAITATNKFTEDSGALAGATHWTTTTSIAPTGNKLYLCAVFMKSGGSVDTLTSSGATWVKVADVIVSGGRSISVFRTLMATKPFGGPVTANFSTGQQRAFMIVDEISGIALGGSFGSNAVRQFGSAQSGAATTLTATLAAFGSAANATWMVTTHAQSEATTPEGGYTELADMNASASAFESEFKAAVDTSPSSSWATSSEACAISVEIVAPSITVSMGITLEADNALTFASVRTVGTPAPRTISLGIPIETDTGLVMRAQKSVPLGTPTEVDSILSVEAIKPGLSIETIDLTEDGSVVINIHPFR